MPRLEISRAHRRAARRDCRYVFSLPRARNAEHLVVEFPDRSPPRAGPARAPHAGRGSRAAVRPPLNQVSIAPPISMPKQLLRPGRLALSTLRALWSAPIAVRASTPRRGPRVDAAAATVRDACSPSGETVYGVNTGFGLLARTRIDAPRLAELQRALVLSHSRRHRAAARRRASCGSSSRLKAASLARGHSGVRWEIIELLVATRQRGHRAVHSGAGLGRRVGRPGAARAPRGRR